jgi:uncharacterized membrane protein
MQTMQVPASAGVPDGSRNQAGGIIQACSRIPGEGAAAVQALPAVSKKRLPPMRASANPCSPDPRCAAWCSLFSFFFFVIAVLICVFGLLKTLFIIIFTLAGFFVGAFLLGDESRFKKLLDRILPPGRVR